MQKPQAYVSILTDFRSGPHPQVSLLGMFSGLKQGQVSPRPRIGSSTPEASHLGAANQAGGKTPVWCIMSLNRTHVSGDLRGQEGREVSPLDRARLSDQA